MTANFYDLEPHIIDRVRLKMPTVKNVAPASTLFGEIGDKIDPAGVFVREMGFVKVKDSQGRNPEIKQAWQIIVCVPFRTEENESTAKKRAGPFIWDIIKFFSGWPSPVAGQGIFTLSDSQPPADYQPSGRADFAIQFETQFTIKSDVT